MENKTIKRTNNIIIKNKEGKIILSLFISEDKKCYHMEIYPNGYPNKPWHDLSIEADLVDFDFYENIQDK